MNPEDFKRIASALGKLSHQKSPRSKDYYVQMGKRSADSKKRKKLSTSGQESPL